MKPAYRLFTTAGETALPYLDAAGDTLDLARWKPVISSTQLYAIALQAKVAEFSSAQFTLDTQPANLRRIRVAADTLAGSGTLNAALSGRQVRVGDRLKVTSTCDGNQNTYWRSVVGLLGKVTPAVAAASLTKTAAPTNAAVNNAAAAEKVAAGTSPLIGTLQFAAPAASAVFRGHGRLFKHNGINKLGDELTITVTNVDPGTGATLTVASAALGVTAVGVDATLTGSDYDFSLLDLGYSVNEVVTINRPDGELVIGETVKVRVFPPLALTVLSTELTIGGAYTGDTNLRYVIEVTAVSGSNADVRIYDTVGKEPITTSAGAAHDIETDTLGTLGLNFILANDPTYYAGQKFYVDAVAAVTSTTEFNGVLLDGPVVNAGDYATDPDPVVFDSVDVHQPYTGVLGATNLEGGGDAVTATDEVWAYAMTLGLPSSVTGKTGNEFSAFVDAVGEVVLSYKAVVLPTATESLIAMRSVAEITEKVGETSQENWLGRGAYEAFRGNQNQVVYALRTAGDTVEDINAALKKIRTTDNVYAMAIMTDSLDVMKAARDHAETMSNKFNRNFRRCYVGTDSPGAYVYWGELPGGGYRTAELVAGVVTLSEEFRADWKFTADDIGASIKITSLDLTATITDVLNDYEVETDADTLLSTNGVSGIIVTRPDTAAATALYVIDRAKALNSRRCVNVWADRPTIVESNGLSQQVQAKFMAAEIAGLRCALLPQQGLTTTECASVSNAPNMYARFDPEQLDLVASHGVMVVTQESEGGEMFIRHQLTTSTNAGALAYEDNVGVIVDEFSFSVKDRFRGYRGRRNVTPDTIAEIDDELKELAQSYTLTSLQNRQIGPPVLSFYDEKGVEGQVTVRQDSQLADSIMTYVKLRIPLPLNGINHYIDVEVSENVTGADG